MSSMLSRLTPYGLSFLSSLCIMVLELVASKLVARHVGASLDVWTSVIGIMLGGICLGNVLGGRLADRYEPRSAIGPLYALGALMTISTLWMNAFVGMTPGLENLNWDLRTLVVVALDFLIPGTVLGMISPVVAKIAVEQTTRAGGAIGNIYFWGAVGSIVGTFLALAFIGTWNNFISPQIMLQTPERYPLSVAIFNLRGLYGGEYGLIMAGTLVAIAPVMALFLFLQREFIAGLTSGAVKG